VTEGLGEGREEGDCAADAEEEEEPTLVTVGSAVQLLA
jgi:hypothetical protein